MIFLYNDHNNCGYSWSRYELGNKCVIMTRFCLRSFVVVVLIDSSQLQLNHRLVHLRNSYNDRHCRRDTVLAAYLVCYSQCVWGGVVALMLLDVMLMRWSCLLLCCFSDAVWGFYVLVFGGPSTSRVWLVQFIAPVSYPMDVPRAHESSHTEWSAWTRARERWCFNTAVMDPMSASVGLLSEVFAFGTIWWLWCAACWTICFTV